MPPKRSTRSASAKPPSQSAPKPASKVTKNSAPPSRTLPSKKRSASPDRASPPPKRSKTDAQKLENHAPDSVQKPKSKTLANKKSQPRSKLTPVPEAAPTPAAQLKPYFNPLPSPPEKKRPGLQLFAWGAGNFGQFGMGPDVLGELDKPKKNVWVDQQIQAGAFGQDGAGLETIAAGGLHSILVDENGTIWTCGVNDDAALGRITKDVPDPDNPGAFLSVDELTSIPHSLQSLLDEQFRAVKVVSGDSISAAVSATGDVRVWGSFRASEGALGFSNGLKHQFLPTLILNLSHKSRDNEKVSSIASGANHLLVLTTHGNIYTWGAGEHGQLGRRVLERRKIHGTVPEKIYLASRARKAVVLGAGIYTSFAVDDKGDVWGWGLNSMGQTGTGFATRADAEVPLPKRVKRLSKKELGGDTVVEIVGGEQHTLFLTSAGKVYACGRSNAGQLGLSDDDVAFNDRSDPDFLPEPVLVTFPDNDDPVVQVSAGVHNNMAVTRGGALYAWGQGTQGELGVPDIEVKTPRVIVRKEGGSWTAVAVACGGQHTLGLFRKK